MAAICSALGLGVNMETTNMKMMMKTNNHTSKISQLVCQNHVVYSQKAPSITALPELVSTLVNRRNIPMEKPQISPHSPAFGVIFFEKMPNVNTATMAGAISDCMS